MPSTEANPSPVYDNTNKGQLDGKFNKQNEKKPENWLEVSKIQNFTYEPTNISNVYSSMYWRWRRVKGYYNEITEEDIDWNKRYKEAKAVMNN